MAKEDKPTQEKSDKEIDESSKTLKQHLNENTVSEDLAESEVDDSPADEILAASSDSDVDTVEDEKELKKKILKEKDERKPRFDEYEDVERVWEPRTDLGKKVKSGEIKNIHEIMSLSVPIKEVGVVDALLPGLEEEVLDVGRVQRVTDSGRSMRFRVVTAVGNRNGYIGVGEAKGKEAGPTIRKSIERAKMHIVEIKRGCGSWECGCGEPHTVPFKVTGMVGSVKVTLIPAPRGVGIVSGKIAKTVLSLAGIKDVWVTTDGHTRTGINFAHAVVNALENTNYIKISEEEMAKLKIVTGAVAQPTGEKVSEAGEEKKDE
ncbi:MAG: 30S ribosomal protein S5 [Candidatus Altiarchaeota archaeon]|nr:30S ribosomal protein S5 [Candidatus Altiarchaeota archaeon]